MNNQIINNALEVIDIEVRGLINMKSSINKDFVDVVEVIHKNKGKVILIGTGKSGIIGKKISSSLASTGTPSFYIHTGDALHGDLGMIEQKDIVIVISSSGETEELLNVVYYLNKKQISCIAMTNTLDSRIARNSNYHILINAAQEACPFNLAPTCSSTNSLVLGDAIVVSLMKLRKFTSKKYSELHPGGTLGRRLLTLVGEIMHTKNLPTFDAMTDIKEIVHSISKGGFGVGIELNKNGKITGVISDGDIRRAMVKYEKSFFNLKSGVISTNKPIIISRESTIYTAKTLMEEKKINFLLVANKDLILEGICRLRDTLKL
jgi:arabinose-5-phosphate isomerase